MSVVATARPRETRLEAVHRVTQLLRAEGRLPHTHPPSAAPTAQPLATQDATSDKELPSDESARLRQPEAESSSEDEGEEGEQAKRY